MTNREKLGNLTVNDFVKHVRRKDNTFDLADLLVYVFYGAACRRMDAKAKDHKNMEYDHGAWNKWLDEEEE
jgi:hypothetical protein